MRARRRREVAQDYAVRLMQHLVVPTFVLNPNRQVVIWNRACERLTGVSASRVIGTREHWRAFYEEKRYCLADVVALGLADELDSLYPEHKVPADGVGLSAENWCVMPKLGSHLYLAIDAGPIYDEVGNLIAVVETLRDMTDQKRAEACLKTLASIDGLTGLANRRSFDETLSTEWSRARRSRKPLSLLLADVDHFKLYNDLHGHQEGDECLRTIAIIMGQNTRPTDLSARYGGEEFAMILPETDHPNGCSVAQRLKAALSKCAIVHGASAAAPLVTLSMGVATQIPDEDSGCDLLLSRADQALYAAKHSGRDRFVSAENVLEVFGRRGSHAVGHKSKGASSLL